MKKSTVKINLADLLDSILESLINDLDDPGCSVTNELDITCWQLKPHNLQTACPRCRLWIHISEAWGLAY
jgi:hypothetical protein